MPVDEVTIELPLRRDRQGSAPSQGFLKKLRMRQGVSDRSGTRCPTGARSDLETTAEYVPAGRTARHATATSGPELVERGQRNPSAEARDMLRARLGAAAR